MSQICPKLHIFSPSQDFCISPGCLSVCLSICINYARKTYSIDLKILHNIKHSKLGIAKNKISGTAKLGIRQEDEQNL